MKRSRSEQQCGRLRCARGSGGRGGFAADGSKAAAATASDFFERAERACLRVHFGCRAWEASASCLPPRSSLTFVSKQREGLVFVGSRASAHPVSKERRRAHFLFALAASDTPRPRFDGKKKQNKGKKKTTQRFVVKSIGNFLCGFWAP